MAEPLGRRHQEIFHLSGLELLQTAVIGAPTSPELAPVRVQVAYETPQLLFVERNPRKQAVQHVHDRQPVGIERESGWLPRHVRGDSGRPLRPYVPPRPAMSTDVALRHPAALTRCKITAESAVRRAGRIDTPRR